MNDQLSIQILPDEGDARGSSYQVMAGVLAFLTGVQDVHMSSVRPGSHRGNHYHCRRKEVLVVRWSSPWRFVWRAAEDHERRERRFEGAGAALICVPTRISHAVVNEGTDDLWITAVLDSAFDAANMDVVSDPVV